MIRILGSGLRTSIHLNFLKKLVIENIIAIELHKISDKVQINFKSVTQ
jgi:hypothetical protein